VPRLRAWVHGMRQRAEQDDRHGQPVDRHHPANPPEDVDGSRYQRVITMDSERVVLVDVPAYPTETAIVAMPVPFLASFQL